MKNATVSQRPLELQETAAAAKKKPSEAVAIISYDEKPGIQAIATTAPDLPPEPGAHASVVRDHEHKRQGTASLLAGIDLLTGKVHALVKDRHRSREFIELLELVDAAYPAHTAIALILDNHSAPSPRRSKPGSRSTKRTFRIHLRSMPGQTARQLPDKSTPLWVEPSSTGDTRPRRAPKKAGK
jgi:hypothetical protein